MPVYVLRDGFSNKFQVQRKSKSDQGVAKVFSPARSSALSLFEVIEVDQGCECEAMLKRRLRECALDCSQTDGAFLLDPILVLTVVRDVRQWFADCEVPGEGFLEYANEVSRRAWREAAAEDEGGSRPNEPNRDLVFLRANSSYWKVCFPG